MYKIKADLHIHSCLSPCGSLDNTPVEIAKRVKAAGLDAAALTDHNNAGNCRTFFEEAERLGIIPLCGMEITTAEEAHVLALFDAPEKAEFFSRIIYNSLPDFENRPDIVGDQVICDKDENIEFVSKFLLNATPYSFDQIKEMTEDAGGVFIPAHIDRPSFSIIIQLGFLPPLEYSAVEVTTPTTTSFDTDLSRTADSDAHYLEDIGKRYTIVEIEEKTPTALLEALKLGRTEPVFSPVDKT